MQINFSSNEQKIDMSENHKCMIDNLITQTLKLMDIIYFPTGEINALSKLFKIRLEIQEI